MGSIIELQLAHFQVPVDSKFPISSEPRMGVSVQNAFKKYSTKKDTSHILNGFNMSVEQGKIYSLLGSSGCGKTTLLSCVVGMKQLDSGDIFVFGARPGTKGSGIPGRRIGYMPQEIALYGEFSIAEVLRYFGRLYGMTAWEVTDNTKFLVTFLNLPPETRRINTLSGGQQRRVSFAVALIHNPELLILDEPTVGVDPLLRQNIWSHLVKLASTRGTTVIITTHFIEEARDSDCIGLMRNGKLLIEDSPTALMDRYNTYILEDIVVQVCLRDSNSAGEHGKVKIPTSGKSKSSDIHQSLRSAKSSPNSQYEGQGPDLNSILDDGGPEISSPAERRPSLGHVLHRASQPNGVHKHSFKVEAKEKCERIYALLMKNVLVLVRNFVLVCFIIGVPSVQVVLVCLAIGIDPHGIKLAVVNHEIGGETSCSQILKNKAGCIMSSQEKYNSKASCQFINSLDQDVFKLIPYKTQEEAMNDIRLTKLWGVMIFSANFTENLKDRFLFGVYAGEDNLKQSRVTFHLDMSSKQVGLQIQKNLYSSLQDFMFSLARACKVDTNGMDTPLHFDTPVYGNNDTNFTEFIAPGVLLSLLFFFPLCSAGVSMITEKKSGAMERTMVTGVTHLDLMISHFLTQIVLLICQAAFSFAIMISVFKIQVHGSIVLALALGMEIGISGISFGFLMAAVCNDELEAVMVSMATFFPNFILSGVMWPLEGMPYYLQHISYALPCTLAGETLRSIIARGVTFSHNAVWPGFLSTWIYICFYWVLTLSYTHFKKRK